MKQSPFLNKGHCEGLAHGDMAHQGQPHCGFLYPKQTLAQKK